MSGNVAIIYTGGLEPVAEAFGEAAGHVAARVRLRSLAEVEPAAEGARHEPPTLDDLEWADGIAFGTPACSGVPAPELMRFIEGTEPLWSSGRLYDQVVTAFTDEPEHIAPDSVLHPIYDALYGWGAVIIGPRGFKLEREARPGADTVGVSSPLSVSRLRSARHRAARLARLAGVLAEDHARRERLEL